MIPSKNSLTLTSPRRKDALPQMLINPPKLQVNSQATSPLKSALAKTDRLKSPLSVTIATGKPKLEPLLSPKQNSRKKLGISVQISPKAVTSITNTTQISYPRNPLELSSFMASLYKKPIEKSEDNAKSFISFRSIALNNSINGSAADKALESQAYRSETPFLPPMEPDHWRTQLDLNKKREGLFQQTIHGMFMESNQNFYKLLKQKEKQTRKMPHVRIYTSAANGFRPDLNKTPVNETPVPPDATNNQADQNKTRPSQDNIDYTGRIRMAKDEPYKFYQQPPSDVSLTLRKPHAREGATLTTVGKNVYLYGGVSREVYNEWEVLDTTSWTWSRMEVTGDTPPTGRFGHLAERYQNSIVIFGGEKHYNSTLKIRECLSDVRMFIPDKSEWRYIKSYGDFVEPRRNHTGVIVGKHLLIHGGIDTSGLYLNDLMAFNLVTCRWQKVQELGGDGARIAFHRACAVLNPRRADVNLFKMPDMKFDDNIQSIKEEGIYFFGGRTQDEEPLNTLKILKIGNHVLKWKTAITQGRTPDARFLHSMTHCRKLNLLVVYGGRCDGDLANPACQNNPYLYDINVLQLDNLTWVKVTTNGLPGQNARCSHSAAVVGSKMIVLGGIHHNTYCPPDHDIYEMDQAVARNLEKKLDHKTLVTRDHAAEDWNEMKKHHNHKRTTMVSFLPVPLLESSPKKVRQVSRKEAAKDNDNSFDDY